MLVTTFPTLNWKRYEQYYSALQRQAIERTLDNPSAFSLVAGLNAKLPLIEVLPLLKAVREYMIASHDTELATNAMKLSALMRSPAKQNSMLT
ncbi:hypothetical protein WDW86_18530 [Bdellovibrionota bacterium FG-2]